MNKIKRINQFLGDYQNLNSYFKELLLESKNYYISELQNEWKKLDNHPFPKEYNNYYKMAENKGFNEVLRTL